jgi:surface carbohydrate biosynthesis protein
MEDIDVLFLVERVAREMETVTCLTHVLAAEHGLESEVRSYYNDFDTVRTRFSPRVVVFPFFYGADHDHPVEYLKAWPKAEFLTLAWEQILMSVDHGMKTPRDDAAKTRVHHICWTADHKRFLQEGGARPEKLLLTGSPVLKLYEEPYRRYFPDRATLAARHGLDPSRKWVLFTEAYQFAFFPPDHLKFLAACQNADPELMRQAQDYSLKCMSLLFEWLAELRRDDDPIVILRPRPSSTVDMILEFARRMPRPLPRAVNVIQAGNAREWILASDQVVSSTSTTIIEAALAGKAVRLFSPLPYPPALRSDWHDLVPILRGKDRFLEELRRPVGAGMPRSAPRRWLAALADGVRPGAGKANGRDLRRWAAARFFPAGDPIREIAAAIARLSGNPARGTAAYVPEYRRLPREEPAARPERGEGQVPSHDDFTPRDVADAVGRWRRILTAARPLPRGANEPLAPLA